ncbi:MAG: p-hydroxycinnamoyl CoA hydratase/lyase [Deltaproteobacteria bacterium RIFCSPLOWO2_02_FULL_57_26]|nr:MAG: p-hydroxycinnamoyl CoA hydratase/lyase [Deltaproteobacteria bacterium RIFCSPLOWO2_02_FULL_57_26]OGQ76794.1 MAG: p-hydroxycinnamoyl CoA hydratase/lyase [Deltaproteobacteria bacterium RIFCSPLOWO2_12_FULL_57_22]
MTAKSYATVKVEKEGGISWVILNRPEKRNAMNPQLHYDMLDAITELEVDDEAQVLVLTGAGDSWCAGQDLKEFFRALDNKPAERRRAGWASQEWRWRRLFTFPKPTIAMVNGFCFGGAFTPLIACDFAIAAEDAIFGLSEINWGIFPGGLVSRVLADALSYRDAMYYIMTGDTFDGRKAAEMKLVNYAVPREKLREETVKLAKKLMTKNPQALRAAKEVYKLCRTMDYSQAEDYLAAKGVALRATDPERGREEGIKQFIDEKKYRPGLGAYNRKKA